jgi:hypothetical protein
MRNINQEYFTKKFFFLQNARNSIRDVQFKVRPETTTLVGRVNQSLFVLENKPVLGLGFILPGRVIPKIPGIGILRIVEPPL